MNWSSTEVQNISGDSAPNEKGRSLLRAPPFALIACGLLLRRSDGVLGGLGHAELDDGLRLDLDSLAGLRVTAHAGFALGLHQAADTRDYEYAVLLRFLDGSLGQQIKEGCRLLVGDFELLGHLPCKCGLGQSCCHVMFSFCWRALRAAVVDGLPPRDAYRMRGSDHLINMDENPVFMRLRRTLPMVTMRLCARQSQWEFADFHRFFLVFAQRC